MTQEKHWKCNNCGQNFLPHHDNWKCPICNSANTLPDYPVVKKNEVEKTSPPTEEPLFCPKCGSQMEIKWLILYNFGKKETRLSFEEDGLVFRGSARLYLTDENHPGYPIFSWDFLPEDRVYIMEFPGNTNEWIRKANVCSKCNLLTISYPEPPSVIKPEIPEPAPKPKSLKEKDYITKPDSWDFFKETNLGIEYHEISLNEFKKKAKKIHHDKGFSIVSYDNEAKITWLKEIGEEVHVYWAYLSEPPKEAVSPIQATEQNIDLDVESNEGQGLVDQIDKFLLEVQDEITHTIKEVQEQEGFKDLGESLKSGLEQLKDSTAGLLEKGADILRVDKPIPEPEEPEVEEPPQPVIHTKIEATRAEIDQKPLDIHPEPRAKPQKKKQIVFKYPGYVTTQENWINLQKSKIKYEFTELSLQEFKEKCADTKKTGITPTISYDPEEQIAWINEYSDGIKIIWAKIS